MPGGRRSRQKGDREERALVNFLQAAGFAAERVPGSGAYGGKYLGDLTLPLLGKDRCAEVKVRGGRGFQQIYKWLEQRDLLFIRQSRCEPLVIVPLRLAAEIARHAEGAKSV